MGALSPHSLLHVGLCSPRGQDELFLGHMLSTGADVPCLAILVCLSGSSFLSNLGISSKCPELNLPAWAAS